MNEKLLKARGSKTQKEVAEALNISISALSAYENGTRSPRDDLKKRMSKYYETTVEELFF